MKTYEQILEYKSNAFDGRDSGRLMAFVKEEDLGKIGVSLKEEYVGKHTFEELTRENVLAHLKSDLEFAFEKALDCRGLSSAMMFHVIKMWNWILEEGLEEWDDDDYAQYGLPLYKATAVKYGFDNPIGDDEGNESKYEEQ